MSSKLKIIKNKKEVKKLIEYCQLTKYASIDFETTSFKYHSATDYPLIMAVSFQPGSSWIIPLGHKDSPFKNKWLKLFRYFCKEVIENPNVVKVAWNLKFEYKWFLKYGIVMRGILFDAMLAKYCLDEERPHDLKSLVSMFFPEHAGYENDIKVREDGDEVKTVDWVNTDFTKLCTYCGLDADLTLRAMVYFEPKLIKLKFYSLFRNLLMMMTRVLAEAEFGGMLIDKPYLESQMKKYEGLINESMGKLKSTRSLLRFEKGFKKAHIQKLIDRTEEEIETFEEELLETDDPKEQGSLRRKITFRENKVKRLLEGDLRGKKEIYDGMNFNSPNQLIDFLFLSEHGLQLKVVKYTKDKKTKQFTERPSTDEEVLEKLKKKDKSGFMSNLLEYRGLVKLDSTYISGIYPKLDDYNRVHAGFLIHGTVTGRLSCKGPNLQNIPRDTTASDIKRMFIPPKGMLLLEVDYGQAELRVIAEVSGDIAMIDIFKRGYNIHVATACKMNGGLDQYDEVKKILKQPDHPKWLFWEKEKKKGKSLNFSIVYQQGDDATAETLDCSLEEAAQFKKDWFAQFPQVHKWIKNQKKLAFQQGFVMNMFGRKRRLPNIYSFKGGLKAEAERQAVNAPIQGTSGDFALFSQVIIRERRLTGELPFQLIQVYTVHDSIGFYIYPEDIHKVVPKIIEICDNPQTKKYFGFQLEQVKMKVSPEVGAHWAGLQEYSPEINYTKFLEDETNKKG